MIEVIIISAIIGMYLWMTEEEGVLRKPFAWLASRVSNKYLRKGLFDCLHCRTFWASVIVMSVYSCWDINYLFCIPLTWILSITGYRLIT